MCFTITVDLDARPKGGEQAKVKFYAPIFVGFRQLEIERWPGTPLYSMEFGNPQSASRMKLPLTVTLERAEVDADSPDSEEQREDARVHAVLAGTSLVGCTTSRRAARCGATSAMARLRAAGVMRLRDAPPDAGLRGRKHGVGGLPLGVSTQRRRR